MAVIGIAFKLDDKQMRSALRRSRRDIREWSRSTGRTVRRIAIAAAGAFGETIRRSVSAFASFERELAAAAARTGVGLRRFRAEYEAEIRRIALTTGIEAEKVTRAVDKAVSGGLSGAAAASVAEAAARAEAAGLGIADTLVSAATTVATAFRGELEDAGHAVDVLVSALQRGDGAAQDFAPALKQNALLAARLGVRLTDTAAALSTISNVAPSVSQAGTQLQSFLKTFAADAGGIRDKLQGVADATGLEVTLPAVQARLRAGDLSGVVRDLSEALLPRDLAALAARAREATGAAHDELMARLQEATAAQIDQGTAAGSVFGRVEALQAFLALAGDYEAFLERSTANAKALGEATDRAFSDTATTSAYRWAVLMRRVDELLRQIGETVAPALEPLVNVDFDTAAWREFAGFLRAIADNLVRLTLFAARHRVAIVKLVGAYGAWLVLGTVKRLALSLGLVVVKLTGWIRALTAAMIVAKVKALAMNLAIGGLVVAGAVALGAVTALAGAVITQWDEIKTATKALVENVGLRFERWKLHFQTVWAGLKAVALLGIRALLNAISTGLNGIVDFINKWIRRINIVLLVYGKKPLGYLSGFDGFGGFLDDDVAKHVARVRELSAAKKANADAIAASSEKLVGAVKDAGRAVGNEFLGILRGVRDQALGLFGFGDSAFDADSFAAGFRPATGNAQTFARPTANALGIDPDAWRRWRAGAGGGSGDGGSETEGPALQVARRFSSSLREAFAQQDFGGLADRLREKFRAALVDNFFDRVAENLPGLFAKGGGGFGQRAGGFLRNVFSFHEGGVVPGPPGAEVFALLEAGERVSPANAPGGAVVQNFAATYVGDVDDAVRRANARQVRANAQAAREALREARL